jgi:hypothetical protein
MQFRPLHDGVVVKRALRLPTIDTPLQEEAQNVQRSCNQF